MTTDFQPSDYARRDGERREGERRAVMQVQVPMPQDSWHLDKKVPLSLICTILIQAAMVIWAIADIKKDVELLKQDTAGLHIRDTAQGDSLKEAMKLMQDQFARLDSKLDRIIERGQK